MHPTPAIDKYVPVDVKVSAKSFTSARRHRGYAYLEGQC